jgi:glycine/D-amino acid oxidase-like deaminating enzyme
VSGETRRVIVVGAGVFGAAAALELRRRGWRVVLVDEHPTPHEGAASTDVSKIVRMDYGSDGFYHELAERALEGWDRWNGDWPRALYHQDGFLVLSREPMAPGGFEHDSWMKLRERGYSPVRLERSALAERFPAWRPSTYADAYFNPRAGWVESTAVVERLVSLARAAGVEHVTARVTRLLESDSRVGGVRVATALSRAGALSAPEATSLSAGCVVVCAGAWTPSLLPWLADRLRSVAQPVLHFQVRDPAAYRGDRFPPWAADIAGSGWYGFPALADGRLKIGHHGPGVPAHPDTRGDVPSDHVARARAFFRDSLPALADAPLVGQRVCMYCDTSDGDFLIDRDPDREGLVIASGGSGHAFKFAPVLGALVADAVEGRTSRASTRFGWRAAADDQEREQARARK